MNAELSPCLICGSPKPDGVPCDCFPPPRALLRVPEDYRAPLVGEPVWAAMGDYGWSAAVVTREGSSPDYLYRVAFPQRGLNRKGKTKSGERHVTRLVSRRPSLNGKDKPRPLREEKE